MNITKATSPLLSWEFYSDSYDRLLSDTIRKQIMYKLEEYKEQFQWDVDLQEIIDSTEFQALVLTNEKQEIEYASEGFKKLTGYPFNFIKGKSPQFLQGENTCFETRARIRESIKEKRPFEEKVVNYRKSGEEYNCLIAVFPIKDKTNVITHFIALEREV